MTYWVFLQAWLAWIASHLVFENQQILEQTEADTQGLEVQTTTGIVTGFINETAPKVRQFLGIPYAHPPVADLRWLPPVPLTPNSSVTVNATLLPPSCPQHASKVPTVLNRDVHLPQPIAALTPEDQYTKTSEDCLTLAIWTPVTATADARLPVLFFMTGGAFTEGGINIAWQLPYHWVQHTQSHIVVTINYRLNIFGFPNARGLDSQNLAILDQRVALEWVRDNVRAFGGDPSRITLWGQSAGAASVEYHNFAFPNDVIAAGLFMQSGSGFMPLLPSKDLAQTNFSFVAKSLGCGNLNAQEEVACMRNVDFQVIENFVGEWTDNRTLVDPSLPLLRFSAVPDDHVVFKNYTERYESGAFSKVPAIFSMTSNEAAGLVPYPADPAHKGPDPRAVTDRTRWGHQCPESRSERLRASQGCITYRWLYDGNFSNISPRFWMGAYHSSDLPLLFGTHQDYSESSTDLEFATSHTMQDHLLAFAEDPFNGPPRLGWHSTLTGFVPRFGADGQAISWVSQQDLSPPC